MARTDALAGRRPARRRSIARCAYVEAGADMIFPEAITELAMYKAFAAAVKVPILANITEFGATPLFTRDELRSADVAIALYPLSAFRAMNKAALDRVPDAAPRRHAEGRRRPHADARGALRLPRLSRVRAAISTRCSPPGNDGTPQRADAPPQTKETRMTDAPAAPKPKKSVALSGVDRRQHGAVHGRPHRQRPRATAATTSSTSPTPANSRRSRTC